jgi:hypothetical protein
MPFIKSIARKYCKLKLLYGGKQSQALKIKILEKQLKHFYEYVDKN